MNNPLRSLIQRQFEARRLLRMGGRTEHLRVLEVGCGWGVGVEIILDVFGAENVDAFDLDPHMVELARRRLIHRGDRIHVSTGDVTAIRAEDCTYDAVFDFGIIHHVPDWQSAVREVHRVLKGGGRFFAEEVHTQLIMHPIWRRLLDHPTENRFEHAQFIDELRTRGFDMIASCEMWGWFGWYVAEKPISTSDERRGVERPSTCHNV